MKDKVEQIAARVAYRPYNHVKYPTVTDISKELGVMIDCVDEFLGREEDGLASGFVGYDYSPHFRQAREALQNCAIALKRIGQKTD